MHSPKRIFLQTSMVRSYEANSDWSVSPFLHSSIFFELKQFDHHLRSSFSIFGSCTTLRSSAFFQGLHFRLSPELGLSGCSFRSSKTFSFIFRFLVFLEDLSGAGLHDLGIRLLLRAINPFLSLSKATPVKWFFKQADNCLNCTVPF